MAENLITTRLSEKNIQHAKVGEFLRNNHQPISISPNPKHKIADHYVDSCNKSTDKHFVDSSIHDHEGVCYPCNQCTYKATTKYSLRKHRVNS